MTRLPLLSTVATTLAVLFLVEAARHILGGAGSAPTASANTPTDRRAYEALEARLSELERSAAAPQSPEAARAPGNPDADTGRWQRLEERLAALEFAGALTEALETDDESRLAELAAEIDQPTEGDDRIQLEALGTQYDERLAEAPANPVLEAELHQILRDEVMNFEAAQAGEAELRRVECAGALCRIEFDHAHAAGMEILDALGLALPSGTATTLVPVMDGDEVLGTVAFAEVGVVASRRP